VNSTIDKKIVAVVGFGKTGRSLLDFLLENPICREKYKKIYLYNDFPINDRAKMHYYEEKGVEFVIGESSFVRIEQAGVLLLSPGINGRSSRFETLRQRGGEILSEIEFASHFFKAKVVSVSGTNGKSTTVSFIHHILKENGVHSLLLGNIGKPLISEVGRITADSVVVLELSSFQLEEIADFKSHIAMLLNISPDHLDRYSNLTNYFSAKKNIFKNQAESDFMVLNYDDPLLRENAGSFGPAKTVWFSRLSMGIGEGAYIENDHIVLKLAGSVKRISIKENPLRGLHNLENLLAAVTVAVLCGIKARGIEKSIAGFKGLTHRMEPAGKIGAVEFINDSKATNVDAALKSISSINTGMVLILGGKDKGGDFALLGSAIKERVKKVLLLGSAAPAIYEQLADMKEKFIFIKDLSEAAASGYEILKESGGVVLLAPACASFDMFDNFEHRGEVFKKECHLLAEKVAHG
jgi:UDP-N-acetylmuramoylalanine--D-glutamate ligase